jgi:hypothetical protein
MLVTAVKQTTIMSDNITAYSTAVGPSSLFKKRFNFMAKFFIIVPSDRYLGFTELKQIKHTSRVKQIDLIAMISIITGATICCVAAGVLH